MTENEKTALEAATFRRLVNHLQKNTDVQNIDLMIIADFCRNCLSNWYAEEAAKLDITVGKENVREMVYGMPYTEWKSRYQTEASPEKMQKYQERQNKKAEK